MNQTNKITVTAEYTRFKNTELWESYVSTKLDQGDPKNLPQSFLDKVLRNALEDLEIFSMDEFLMYAHNERLFCEDDEEEMEAK